MARLARVVIPGLPHLVTQRGNGGARVFFGNDDYALYRDLLVENCEAADVAIWAWCLMPTHVHLILVPSDTDGLRRALAPVHRRYAGIIHARKKRVGRFWHGRFGAVVLDEGYLAAALRYVSLNPVRARLAKRATAWRWSSTRAHMSRTQDGVTAIAPIRRRFRDFGKLLDNEPDDDLFRRLRAAETIGRPLGSDEFLTRVEQQTSRKLKPEKRGPKVKPKAKSKVQSKGKSKPKSELKKRSR
jgi:putative transposase